MNLSAKQTRIILLGIAFVCGGLLAYSYFIEPSRLVINKKEIAVEGWDKEFDGFRAVLISDIHGGSHGVDAEMLKRVVETANAQNPDAIFMLGDYVAQQGTSRVPNKERPLRMPVTDIADGLSGLRAKYGVFGVLGNHDGWYGDEKIIAEFDRVGIRILKNEVVTFEKNGHRLRILGLKDHFEIPDWKVFAADANALLAPTDSSGGVIVLEHSPDVLQMITGDLLISKDLKVMFAGHTHGGQIWLPVLGYPMIPSSYGQKYAAGHVKDFGLDMFVTTGVGTSILPFRFMVPPEIAVVTVRRK